MGHIFHLPKPPYLEDPSTWALLGLVLFIGLIIYLGVPEMMANALDGRAQKIADELDEAKRLREEAQELLASYQRRQREAEQEAEDIVARARRDARTFAEEARAELSRRLDRRAEMAERKIAQAEADALNLVRERAATIATEAAEALLREQIDQDAQTRLFDAGLAELGSKMSQ
ncbi:MAG: ATP F0F1 synthase subunit B [Caulobacterales bacterium]|nr:ATP F0F1 synthase subunit B [Caulobacterales bacterium]